MASVPRLQQPQGDRPAHHLGAIGGLQLLKEIAQVVAHRGSGDLRLLGDLLVGEPPRQPLQHLPLAAAEHQPRRWLQPFADARIEVGLAPTQRLQRPDHNAAAETLAMDDRLGLAVRQIGGAEPLIVLHHRNDLRRLR